MQRVFYKHRAFESEREFRLVISLKTASQWVPGLPQQGIEVVTDLDALVDRVMLGPNLEPAEHELLVSRIKEFGLGDRIVTSSLLGRPRFI